jgi:hypothetical protein
MRLLDTDDMSRAGREPAEDVIRRMTAACEAAGLVVSGRQNRILRQSKLRLIHVWAARKDWPHRLPMLGLRTVVGLDGSVAPIKILCAATDSDPFEKIWVAPTVRDAEIPLDTLSHAIRMILKERDAIVQMMAEGKQPPFTGLHWTWQIVELLDWDLI